MYKESHQPEILGSFDKCYDCGLCRASSSKVEIYQGMKGSQLFLFNNF